ncbi:matrixin family metalloprotease [Pendulispora albinea]|uniref:Matrixin family metalloprotease n=1 Tax=Pendulispora albinea TaxID=2741071 RepID=A0ABZ2MBU1_9BACT
MRNKRAAVWALAASALLTTSFSARDAAAFCRTTTENCSGACCTAGKPLYWKNVCVGYSLQKDGTKQIPFNTVQTIVRNAFDKWTNVDCGAGKKVTLDFRQLDNAACSEVRYNQKAANQNLIVFRDADWDHTDSSSTLGLTTVVYNPESGEIFDADMEINTAQQVLSVANPVPPGGYDFDSIVTHEVGHFLGLAHSSNADATMTPKYNAGTQDMRDLAPDDIAGVCSIYLSADGQPGAQYGRRATSEGRAVGADACDPTPRHGFSVQCNEASGDKGGGCSIGATRSDLEASSTSGASTTGLFAALGMVLTAGFVRRRNVLRRK